MPTTLHALRCAALPAHCLQDWHAAVQYVRTQLSGSVDSSRLCLWGTSFAGGHVLAVARDTPGITAIVSQVCGWQQQQQQQQEMVVWCRCISGLLLYAAPGCTSAGRS